MSAVLLAFVKGDRCENGCLSSCSCYDGLSLLNSWAKTNFFPFKLFTCSFWPLQVAQLFILEVNPEYWVTVHHHPLSKSMWCTWLCGHSNNRQAGVEWFVCFAQGRTSRPKPLSGVTTHHLVGGGGFVVHSWTRGEKRKVFILVGGLYREIVLGCSHLEEEAVFHTFCIQWF